MVELELDTATDLVQEILEWEIADEQKFRHTLNPRV